MTRSRSQSNTFQAVFLPHLDAAYNLAFWLTKHAHDAQDIVQDSCLRAYRFYDSDAAGNPRSWLLTIVRNRSYTHLKRHRQYRDTVVSFDESLHTVAGAVAESHSDIAKICADIAGRVENNLCINKALHALPVHLRDVAILREIEGFSYKEIAEITSVPMGTVMSRLARARRQLPEQLMQEEK